MSETARMGRVPPSQRHKYRLRSEKHESSNMSRLKKLRVASAAKSAMRESKDTAIPVLSTVNWLWEGLGEG